MDLEKLTKTQIILLALLVSFVTSIATGITTVTHMDQAPPSITQPITRVVQNTVEKIIPGETKEITKTETIIIKEEDLIIEAINKNKGNIIAITSVVDDENGESSTYDDGFIISKDGFVVVDSAFIAEEGNYFINIEENVFDAEFIGSNESGFSLLKMTLPDGQLEPLPYAILLTDLKSLNEGQKVIALSSSPASVSTGIISGFSMKKIILEKLPIEENGDNIINDDGEAQQEIAILDKILTTLNLSNEQSGSLVINSDGQVIGFAIVREGRTIVIPAEKLIEVMQQLSIQNKEKIEELVIE